MVIISNSFSASFPHSPPFRDSYIFDIIWVLSHRSLRFSFLLQPFFPLFYKLDKFCWFIFKFVSPLFWHLQYSVKPIPLMVNTDTVLFSSRTFILYISHFHTEHSPRFLFMMTMFLFKPMNLFLTVVLKSLYVHFNMWVNVR